MRSECTEVHTTLPAQPGYRFVWVAEDGEVGYHPIVAWIVHTTMSDGQVLYSSAMPVGLHFGAAEELRIDANGGTGILCPDGQVVLPEDRTCPSLDDFRAVVLAEVQQRALRTPLAGTAKGRIGKSTASDG